MQPSCWCSWESTSAGCERCSTADLRSQLPTVWVVHIDLLFVEDCPNRDLTRRNIDTALASAGRVDVVVAERQVDSEEEARSLGMHGSPTVLVSGRDPFAVPGSVASLSCRLYRSGDAVSGAPSVEDLATVLADG